MMVRKFVLILSYLFNLINSVTFYFFNFKINFPLEEYFIYILKVHFISEYVIVDWHSPIQPGRACEVGNDDRYDIQPVQSMCSLLIASTSKFLS